MGRPRSTMRWLVCKPRPPLVLRRMEMERPQWMAATPWLGSMTRYASHSSPRRASC